MRTAEELQPPSERERLFVEAAAAFFRDPDSTDYWGRVRRWEQAMAKVYTAFPHDPEAAAFYALAHLATAPPERVSREHADHAAAILLDIYRRKPSCGLPGGTGPRAWARSSRPAPPPRGSEYWRRSPRKRARTSSRATSASSGWVRAWLAFAEQDRALSVTLMREAAELEASTPKHAVTPGATLPAHELLGDLFLAQGQPAEALLAYRQSLGLYPGAIQQRCGRRACRPRLGRRTKRPLVLPAAVGRCGRSYNAPGDRRSPKVRVRGAMSEAPKANGTIDGVRLVPTTSAPRPIVVPSVASLPRTRLTPPNPCRTGRIAAVATDRFLTKALPPAPRAVDARSLALIAEEDRIAFYQLLPIPESSELTVAAPTLFPALVTSRRLRTAA